MAQLFDIDGDDLDVGFVNLQSQAHQQEREIVRQLEAMWARYEPYSDPDFREAFARSPESRFWELALGCYLLDAGKPLVPMASRYVADGCPDFCIRESGTTIWIEAIAPGPGDDPQDGIPELIPLNQGGRVSYRPTRQIHLRITSALWTKKQVIDKYLTNGVIAPADICIIAIGAAQFGIKAAGFGHPLALSAVFPIGNEYVRVDRNSLEVVDQGYEHSPEIERAGLSVPRTAFLDELFSRVSGLIWSRVSIGNMNREQRPLSYIHNPLANTPLSPGWGVWDREFQAVQTDQAWEVSDIL